MAPNRTRRSTARPARSRGRRSCSPLTMGILAGVAVLGILGALGWFTATRDPSPAWTAADAPKVREDLDILPAPAHTFHELRAAGRLAQRALAAARTGTAGDGQRLVWSVNGEEVGHDALLSPDHFARGDAVSLRVERLESDGRRVTLDEVTRVIANSPPRIHTAVLERLPNRPGIVRATVEASDPDGDLLDHQLAWTVDGEPWPAAQGAAADVSGLPSGAELEVEVRVSDGTATVSAKARSLSIDNQPPSLEIASTPTVEDGDDGRRIGVLGARSVDPDGDRVVIEAVQAPAGVGFDAARGALVWSLAEGTESFDVILRATDERGGRAERTLTLRR